MGISQPIILKMFLKCYFLYTNNKWTKGSKLGISTGQNLKYTRSSSNIQQFDPLRGKLFQFTNPVRAPRHPPFFFLEFLPNFGHFIQFASLKGFASVDSSPSFRLKDLKIVSRGWEEALNFRAKVGAYRRSPPRICKIRVKVETLLCSACS